MRKYIELGKTVFNKTKEVAINSGISDNLIKTGEIVFNATKNKIQETSYYINQKYKSYNEDKQKSQNEN